MQKAVRHFLGAALSVLLVAPAAFAQNTVGEISGYVRDTSGGVLQGATNARFGQVTAFASQRIAQVGPRVSF